MFLNRLEESEKVAFLELAHHIARSDNNFSKEQQEIIATYCMEMQIQDIEYDESTFDYGATLAKINNKHSRNIVLLEIMALVYSDNIFHEEEKVAIDVMVQAFGLNKALTVVYTEWSKAMLSLFVQGNALIDL